MSTGCLRISRAVWWSIIWGLPTNSSTHWRPILRVGVRGRLRSIRKKRWWCCGRNTRFVVVCSTALTGPNGLLVRLRRSWVCCQRHRSIFWRRGMVRIAVCRRCGNYRRLLRWPCRTKKHGVSAMMWLSFKLCGRCWANARQPMRGPRRNWISRCVRSFRVRWRPTR